MTIHKKTVYLLTKMRKITKIGILATLLAAIGIGSLGYAAKKTKLLDGKISVYVNGKEINVPVYNRFKLTPGSCSGYVRRAAQDIFDKEYSVSNAWDRRYEDELVYEVNNNVTSRFMKKTRPPF